MPSKVIRKSTAHAKRKDFLNPKHTVRGPVKLMGAKRARKY